MNTKEIITKRNLPFTYVISVCTMETEPVTYIFDSMGNVLTLDMQNYKNMGN